MADDESESRGNSSFQSNIFGKEEIGNAGIPPQGQNSETTAAGKLIEKLKYIADSHLLRVIDKSNWLGIAANQGQNNEPSGLINKQLMQPEHLILADTTLALGWTIPAISAAALELPAIPEELKIDMGKIEADYETELTRLQTSWIGKLVPNEADLAALNVLDKDLRNGSDTEAFKAKLEALLVDMKQDLRDATDSAMTKLEERWDIAEAALTTNFDDAKTQAAAALVVANDNTQNIAWNRARDQVAREAARLESEAVSSWASRGFSMPGGVLTAMAARAAQATLNAVSDAAAQKAEKVQQFNLDVARTYVETYMRHMDARINAEITYFREAVGTKLKATEMELDANKAKAKLAFDNLGLRIDFTKFAGELATKYRLGVVEAATSVVRAWADLRDSERQTIESLQMARIKQQEAVLDYYRAAIQAAEVGFKVDLTNLETDTRWATIAAQFIGQSVAQHVKAASDSADLFAKIAGMALGGMTGIAVTSATSASA